MREYPGALSHWLGVTSSRLLIVPLLVLSPQAARYSKTVDGVDLSTQSSSRISASRRPRSDSPIAVRGNEGGLTSIMILFDRLWCRRYKFPTLSVGVLR